MADTVQLWWRVTTDEKDKVVSCVLAGPEHDYGFRVFYVLAADEEQAEKKAFNKVMARRTRERRAKLVDEGKCAWCGRPNDREPPKRCSKCSAKDATYSKRWRANARGDDFPPADRSAAIAERSEEKRQAIIAEAAPNEVVLSVLKEVQRAWSSAQTMGAFSEWLWRRIEAAGGRRVA